MFLIHCTYSTCTMTFTVLLKEMSSSKPKVRVSIFSIHTFIKFVSAKFFFRIQFEKDVEISKWNHQEYIGRHCV